MRKPDVQQVAEIERLQQTLVDCQLDLASATSAYDEAEAMLRRAIIALRHACDVPPLETPRLETVDGSTDWAKPAPPITEPLE